MERQKERSSVFVAPEEKPRCKKSEKGEDEPLDIENLKKKAVDYEEI